MYWVCSQSRSWESQNWKCMGPAIQESKSLGKWKEKWQQIQLFGKRWYKGGGSLCYLECGTRFQASGDISLGLQGWVGVGQTKWDRETFQTQGMLPTKVHTHLPNSLIFNPTSLIAWTFLNFIFGLLGEVWWYLAGAFSNDRASVAI